MIPPYLFFLGHTIMIPWRQKISFTNHKVGHQAHIFGFHKNFCIFGARMDQLLCLITSATYVPPFVYLWDILALVTLMWLKKQLIFATQSWLVSLLIYWVACKEFKIQLPILRVKGHLEPTHLKSSPLFTFFNKIVRSRYFSIKTGSRFTAAKNWMKIHQADLFFLVQDSLSNKQNNKTRNAHSFKIHYASDFMR